MIRLLRVRSSPCALASAAALHGAHLCHTRSAATAAKTTIKVKVTASNGESTVAEYKIGDNLMESIRDDGESPADMQGICNGTAQCSTCHVYIQEAWYDRVKELCPLSLKEEDILDVALEVRESSSRLSCQVVLSEELDGLEVSMPHTTEDMRWSRAMRRK